jgi:hypothetical protein
MVCQCERKKVIIMSSNVSIPTSESQAKKMEKLAVETANMSMNENNPYVKMLTYVNPRSNQPTPKDTLKQYMSPADSPGILLLKEKIEEMRQRPETEGYSRVMLTVAELMRLSVDGGLVIEPNIQRECVDNSKWQKAVVGTQMRGTMPMEFHICPIDNSLGLVHGSPRLLLALNDGAQRLSSLINFFQDTLLTPSYANKIKAESGGRMMITGTDNVLEPTKASLMHKAGGERRAMLENLANSEKVVYIYTPNMDSAGRAAVFLQLNDQNGLYPGEILGSYGGWTAVYARRLQQDNPLFARLDREKVDTGTRKEAFNELSKQIDVQYQINASDEERNHDALMGTKPASQDNLQKFAIANTYEKDATAEIDAAYEGVDRILSHIADIWAGDGEDAETFFGFSSKQKAKGVCVGLSTMYMAGLALQDIYGKDWNTAITNNNVAIGIRKAFKQLEYTLAGKTEEFIKDYKEKWKTEVIDQPKGKERTVYNSVKSPSSVDDFRMKLKLITEMLQHPEIAKYLPQVPRDQRRTFSKGDQKRAYLAQGKRCGWDPAGPEFPLEELVAHHDDTHGGGGSSDYPNCVMVEEKKHRARQHGPQPVAT